MSQVRERMAASASETPKVDKGTAQRLEQLSDEARTHRSRLRLYRARVSAGRLSSLERLRELERISELADSRLARAQADSGTADR